MRRAMCIVVVIAASCTAQAQGISAPLDDVVATVNGRQITRTELDERIRPQLHRLEERIFQLRQSALQTLIAEILIEQEAAKRSVSIGSILAGLASGARVEPTEVEAAYDRSRSGVGTIAEFEAKEQIRENLIRRRRGEAFQKMVGDLRKQARIEVFLSAPEAIAVPVSLSADSILGSDGAAVTIIEFSDFECPYSRQAQDALRRVREEFGDKIRFVFKHFPLPVHKTALLASRGAACAGDQGYFWKFHDLLFSETPPFPGERLREFALRIGLDEKQFVACLESDRHSAVVRDNVRAGQAASVQGTPTFIVNGRVYRGVLSLEQWKEILDPLLIAGNTKKSGAER